MTVAVHQPNYLPYPGFFDKWDRADLFVFLDHVHYSRSSWQNRNIINTHRGPVCLSVPVAHRPRPSSIHDIRVLDLPPWRRKHRTTIEHAYARTAHFDSCRPVLEQLYDPGLATLGAVNTAGCLGLADLLGIVTPSIASSALGAFTQTKTPLLIEICRRVGADCYLSGDGSAVYLDTEAFHHCGIELLWQRYTPPVYPLTQQQQPGTDQGPPLSVLDLIAGTGPDALTFLRHARRAPSAGRLPGTR